MSDCIVSICVHVLSISSFVLSGQKTCMHVHGVFPYLYVPYDGTTPLTSYLQQFASSIDKAINITVGNATSSRQFVYKISVVSGMYDHLFYFKLCTFQYSYFYFCLCIAFGLGLSSSVTIFLIPIALLLPVVIQVVQPVQPQPRWKWKQYLGQTFHMSGQHRWHTGWNQNRR